MCVSCESCLCLVSLYFVCFKSVLLCYKLIEETFVYYNLIIDCDILCVHAICIC